MAELNLLLPVEVSSKYKIELTEDQIAAYEKSRFQFILTHPGIRLELFKEAGCLLIDIPASLTSVEKLKEIRHVIHSHISEQVLWWKEEKEKRRLDHLKGQMNEIQRLWLELPKGHGLNIEEFHLACCRADVRLSFRTKAKRLEFAH